MRIYSLIRTTDGRLLQFPKLWGLKLMGLTELQMGFVCSCELHVKVDTLKFSDFVDSVSQNTEQSLDILFLFQSHVCMCLCFCFFSLPASISINVAVFCLF